MELIGELSVFEVFVSAVALLTASYTVYKSFLQGPRISIFTGESVTLVSRDDRESDGPIYLWVSGVAVNKASKVGVLSPLKLCLKDPDNVELVGRVTRFVDAKVDPPSLSPAHALSVPPHGSTPFHIETTIEYSEGLPIVGLMDCTMQNSRDGLMVMPNQIRILLPTLPLMFLMYSKWFLMNAKVD